MEHAYVHGYDARENRRLAAGLSEPEAFDRGVRDLYRTAAADGVFCYTFFKALARKD